MEIKMAVIRYLKHRFPKPLLVLVFAVVIVSCQTGRQMPDHYQLGIKAYSQGDYLKAAEELKKVPPGHPQKTKVRIMLAKSMFKVHLQQFLQAESTEKAVENLKGMYLFAKQTESKEIMKEFLGVCFDSLKKAKDSEFVKALLVNMVAVLKEQADSEDIKEALKLLALRMKDFLFDGNTRRAFLDAIGDLREIIKN